MAIVTSTWRALGSPKRALPLGLVLLGMISAEWLVTQSGAALAIDFGFFVGFCLVAPAGYRLLAPKTGSVGPGQVLYVLLCGAIVFGAAALARRGLGLSWTYIVDPSALGILWVLFCVGGWGLARDIELEAGFLAERLRAERLAESAERASLLALRAHLDPHFLFNTLNAIAEWCREEPAVAETATLKLSSMLRRMLGGIRSASWPLETEIDLGRSLFDLYAIRDRARFRFRIDAPDPLPDVQVPPLLLLPLFENAVTHGPGAGHPGEVVVRLRPEARGTMGEQTRDTRHTLHIEIENPGGFGGRREGGQGIAMVERRLALAYGGRARLSFAGDREHTLAILEVPTEPSLEAA